VNLSFHDDGDDGDNDDDDYFLAFTALHLYSVTDVIHDGKLY